ncbi:uncharacterized protein DUF4232 [Acidipila rosea]|uniref:Uncharacterized protein DUF4232 n=2 Tax=Acidipila rosea TaxID=768535 RepID=A0A4V2PVE1_9BACT|nr:uncharacterized protein DUF4232 [Acidipila rosea]
MPLAAALLLLATGCAHVNRNAAGSPGAPALADDAPLHTRGGTNPNAPYEVAVQKPQLVKRPAIIDINAAAPCNAANLNVFETGAKVNGAYRAVRLAFVNTGAQPCKLGGYPAISLIDQQGGPVGSISIEKVTADTLTAQLGPAQQATFTQPSPEVLLAPRGNAWFEVGYTSSTDCPAISGIAVSAPGTLHLFTINHPLTICAGKIQVTALRGDEGQD